MISCVIINLSEECFILFFISYKFTACKCYLFVVLYILLSLISLTLLKNVHKSKKVFVTGNVWKTKRHEWVCVRFFPHIIPFTAFAKCFVSISLLCNIVVDQMKYHAYCSSVLSVNCYTVWFVWRARYFNKRLKLNFYRVSDI